MRDIGEETAGDDEDFAQFRESINRNRDVIENNLRTFRAYYWDLYESQGFTFAEGYRAWLLEFYLDANRPVDQNRDDDEPWKRG
jgi:hypothetical protein